MSRSTFKYSWKISELTKSATGQAKVQLSLGREIVLPCLIGVLAYVYVTHMRGLWPGDTQWLLPLWNANVDSAAHYLGWEFFRQAPLLQWPLGKIPNLGPGSGSSIAMTDSIPLFAFIFKPLTYWYGGPFQYFGVWTLSCFVLQAVFGWKLLALWITDRFHLLLGTAFLVISPVFIDRLSFHLAISGQWTILAGIYLYFAPGNQFRKWLILGCITTLVQPYLALMVTVLFLSFVVKQYLAAHRQILKSTLQTFGYFAIVTVTAWQSGLFVFGLSNTSTLGYGTYSANGLTFVDPGWVRLSRSLWSSLVPDVWQDVGQDEGFSYLGTGLIVLSIALLLSIMQRASVRMKVFIALVLIVLPVIVSRDNPSQRIHVLFLLTIVIVTWEIIYERFKIDGVQVWTICVASILLIGFSLASTVYLGQFHVVTYSIPAWLFSIFSVFRTSGRMLWPVAYLLSTLIVASIFVKFRKSIAVVLVASCLIFQFVDSRKAISATTNVFSRSGPIDPFQAPLWPVLGDRYSRIDVVLPIDGPRLLPTNPDFIGTDVLVWRDLGIFAIRHRLKLNSFYFARIPTAQLESDSEKLKDVVRTNNFRSDTLYVFIDSEMWEAVKAHHRASDLVGILDGFPIVAPGLEGCADCNFSNFLFRGTAAPGK